MFISDNFGSQRRGKRSLKHALPNYRDPGIVLIAAGLVSAIILVVLTLMFPAETASQVMTHGQTFVRPSEVREGSLLFKQANTGQYVAAPQLKTGVEIEITGMVAYALVIQEFENPGDDWLEGVYVFPLPEDAAVSHLTMDVGARVIEGVIKEREEAKKTYTAAKEEGRKVSLLEQERPNIFMMSVANIGPHERISVELAYQQTVRLDNNIFSLRFPTVVGPRYITGQAAAAGSYEEFVPSGRDVAVGEAQDALRITPPVVEPGQDPDNQVSLEVILDPGFSLTTVKSLYHAVDIDRMPDEKVRISLDDAWAVADRDFVLEWAPAENSMPMAALFIEEKNGEYFIYLMVMPPSERSEAEHHVPREVIFVVDVSGSMAGASIRQAKDALNHGVSRLQPEDRFNIITFNDTIDTLFSYPQTATGSHINKALNYIDNLEANGGTEIRPVLYKVLDGGTNLNRMRQVFFLTDGCVGNEQELFQALQERLGDTRIFTVGIGSAPNSYFMRNIAERGKGSFTYIGKVEEVGDRMQELFLKLENPLLTDIRLSGSSGMEMFPDPIPDLYLSEPVTLIARTGEVPDRFALSGYFSGSYWDREIDARVPVKSEGISILWARQKIKALMDSLDGGGDREQVRAAVIETALEHHLVSRYTSLVAVDVIPGRPGYEDLAAKMVKTGMPRGWQYGKVFGLPQTATVAELCLVLGGLALFLSAVIWLLLVHERVKACVDRKS